MLELRGEPYYASQLLAAEKEIRAVMRRIQGIVAFRMRSSSTSSGEVVANWVEGLEDHSSVDDDRETAVVNCTMDELGAEDEPVQPQKSVDSGRVSYVDGVAAELSVLRVGCSCAVGCHKSITFAEDLANKHGPGGWAVKVDIRNAVNTA